MNIPGMVKWIVIGILTLSILIVVINIPTYLEFQEQMKDSRERLLAGSHIIQTRNGSIEYAQTGQGYRVLVVHGAGGGYDQGLFISEIFLSEDFRVIAPSRYGFLRTPLPANATPAAQADAYIDFLDALNISKVAVIGFSAGGPSSLEFALRHPDRVSALVLVSAVVHKEKPIDLKDIIIHYLIFKSDFLFWMIPKNFESSSLSFFGIPPEVQANLTPDEKRWLSEVFVPSMNPISQRQAGMLNDRINSVFLDYQLDEINVPTLIVYARDDTLVNRSHSESAARKIPDAKVIVLESGGHILMGNHERVRSEIVEFLRYNTLDQMVREP